MVAANYRLASIFKTLLAAGADPNAVDHRGESVLHYAATFATPTMVQQLLERKPDVNVRNAAGETPLITAMTARVMELLLAAGADVHARRNDGLTALDICECARKFQSGLV